MLVRYESMTFRFYSPSSRAGAEVARMCLVDVCETHFVPLAFFVVTAESNLLYLKQNA